MKVVVDENLPPALARALAALFAGDHDILHIRDRYGPGVTDLQWISELSREGSWVVISGDRRIRRNNAEFNAFHASRLNGFFLSAGLYKSPLVKQGSVSWPSGAASKPLPSEPDRARCSSCH